MWNTSINLISPPADFPRGFGLFLLTTASHARTNTAQSAVALLRKVTFVIHKRG